MVKHTVCREQKRVIRMKIFSLYNSYHTTPGAKDQVVARETFLPGRHEHQVVQYQGISIVQTLPAGARG